MDALYTVASFALVISAGLSLTAAFLLGWHLVATRKASARRGR